MTRKRSRAEVAAAVDAIVRADAARAAEFEPQPSEIERVLALVVEASSRTSRAR